VWAAYFGLLWIPDGTSIQLRRRDPIKDGGTFQVASLRPPLLELPKPPSRTFPMSTAHGNFAFSLPGMAFSKQEMNTFTWWRS
jgi:hypothetical protein